MEMTTKLVGIGLAGVLLGWLFFLALGRTTVRRLDRTPETANCLGMEFMSGWRIFNVAYALVLPMAFFRMASKGPLAGLYANALVVRCHTGRVDQVLAHLFVWTSVCSSGLIFAVAVLDMLGVFY
ncbi:hypothetical protein [Alkalilimnicola sp. S0819]|uniref:hypothetical protein n=1 Tax=Alkalilimnicola sp. S0819 TaxID=2613922 RepID=UPI0012617304|nr:hypothetical protein [Alkalilimnicola sp. S0819]KAB7627275.1 hypothetical protein F3N43_05005 [Alkalilimnicola sp. S0819]MPQ15988.1 hypothetical protein [Alkalilimnicola sp. S0819]